MKKLKKRHQANGHKGLQMDEERKMHQVNECLKTVTGIDFMEEMEKFALNDNISELQVKEFLRTKYPGADEPESLSDEDRQKMSLFLRYYFQKEEEHSRLYEEADATRIASPHHKPDLSFYDMKFSNFEYMGYYV